MKFLNYLMTAIILCWLVNLLFLWFLPDRAVMKFKLVCSVDFGDFAVYFVVKRKIAKNEDKNEFLHCLG